MRKIPLNLGTGSDPGINHEASGVRHVNCYVHQLREGKYRQVIYPVPGLKRWDNATDQGATRLLIKLDESTLVGVIGNRIYEYTSNGSATNTASLSGSGRVYSALNMKSTRQICFVTSDKEAFIYENGIATKITDPDLMAATSVTWLDGYFIFSHSNGAFSWTSLNEGTQIDGTDISTSESKPDGLVCVFAYGGYLYTFGTESLEIWRNEGGSNTFVPAQADIPIGCMSGHTVKEMVSGLAFVDQHGVVRLTNGGTTQEISNDTVSHEIEKLSDSDKAALEADVFWNGSYEIYCLQSPGNWTWCFNAKNGTWFELKSYGQNDYRATNSVFFNNKYLIGNRENGELYHIDRDTFDENGNHLVAEVYAPIIHDSGNRIRVKSLLVDTLKGAGINSTSEHDTNPEIMMSYSDDGGHTFTSERRRSMGQAGQYNIITKFNQLGMIKPNGRIFKLSMSAAVNRGFLNADMYV